MTILSGGHGDDIFMYGRGSGNDAIQRNGYWYSDNGMDTVQFGEGLTVESFNYLGMALSAGGDLVMQVKDTGETLTIKNWFCERLLQD